MNPKDMKMKKISWRRVDAGARQAAATAATAGRTIDEAELDRVVAAGGKATTSSNPVED
jgi:hypothetical protein